jgi:hypothetical protein
LARPTAVTATCKISTIEREVAVAQAAQLRERLAASFSVVLAERLVALVAYGSSADGSFIQEFSDFDLAIFMRGEFSVEDAIAVHAGLGDLTPRPFGYLQTKFVDLSVAPEPMLVPGSFSPFWGRLPDEPSYLYEADSLRRSGRQMLETLPSLIANDRAAWAVGVGSARRQRLVRLMTTRLKPAVRSLLVEYGESPSEVWIAGWQDLGDRWRGHDEQAAENLDSVLVLLPPTGSEQEVACGERILRLLVGIERVARSGGWTR